MMSSFRVYLRVITLLSGRQRFAAALIVAGVLIALVQLAEPILFGRAIDAMIKSEPTATIIIAWAVLGLFGIVTGTVVAVGADRLAHERRLAAMSLAFEQAITLPISFHAARGSGAIVRAVLAGTDAIFILVLNFLREQFTTIVGIVFLVPTAMAMDWRLASILLALAVVFAAAQITVMYKTSTGQAAVETYHDRVYSRVGDVLGNVTVVQSYWRLRSEAEAMGWLIEELLAAQRPLLTWWGVLTVMTRSAATIAMVSVLAVGTVLAQRGEVTVGEIVAFIAFANLLITKLDQLSAFVIQIYQQTPILRTFFALLDETNRVTDAPGAAPLEQVKGAIRYEDVTFRYGTGTQGVFDLDFAVLPNQMVALVGPTGAGKTTALALLQRLRDPDSGRISVDGRDIRGVTLASLRQSIGVVFQDASLFNRTIAENIRIGRPDASDEAIMEAARLAEAHEFIMEKPGGYQFVIGERGASLSGGERQRIAIARAILKDAPILILDEATSALDAGTERRIKTAMQKLSQGRTTFVIAHRLSTVVDADQILVMDGGRIVDRGRFADLMAADGLFAKLVRDGGFTEPQDDPPPRPTTTPATSGDDVIAG